MRLAKLIGVPIFFISLIGSGSAGATHKMVDFDGPEGIELFQTAKPKGQFWALIRYFVSELRDSFCGVASSVMVLNALHVPAPVSPNIYPYRVFDQINFFTPAVLEVASPRRVTEDGMTLDQLSKVLRTFSVTVETYRADTVSLDQFRRIVVAALESKNCFVIVNYSRAALGQDGGGHISPLAAYNAGRDRFLVLDVARYKYPPVWEEAPTLWNALNTDDADVHTKRGFVIVCGK